MFHPAPWKSKHFPLLQAYSNKKLYPNPKPPKTEAKISVHQLEMQSSELALPKMLGSKSEERLALSPHVELNLILKAEFYTRVRKIQP